MLISKQLNQGMNEQIGHEFGASLQYLAIASYFENRNLRLLAKLFFEQSEEEHEHGMKFLHYILEVAGELHIPTISGPRHNFASAAEAVQAALEWEMEVTRQINALMDMAMAEKDYMARGMLQWFVDEQLEEINKMSHLLAVIKQAGESNLLTVEAYLVHTSKAD